MILARAYGALEKLAELLIGSWKRRPRLFLLFIPLLIQRPLLESTCYTLKLLVYSK